MAMFSLHRVQYFKLHLIVVINFFKYTGIDNKKCYFAIMQRINIRLILRYRNALKVSYLFVLHLLHKIKLVEVITYLKKKIIKCQNCNN